MKIIHVMSDGSVRNSIEGVVVPAGHPVYQIILNMQRRNEKEKDIPVIEKRTGT